MIHHFWVALLSGWRSRSFRAIGLLAVLMLGGAWLAASFSGRQPAIVALDVGLSAIRLVGVLMVLFWVQELFSKDIERRTVMFVLAYPQSRSTYLLGRFFGVLCLSAVMIALLGMALAAIIYGLFHQYQLPRPPDLGGGFLLALVGIWLELAVVAAFSFWVGTFATTSLMPLSMGAAFAVAARTLGTAIEYAQQASTDLSPQFKLLVQTLVWIVPDLSRLDWRGATLYRLWPTSTTLCFGAGMALAYVFILMSSGYLFFKKREFN